MLGAGVLLRPVADGAEDWGAHMEGRNDLVVVVVMVADSIVHTVKQIDVCHSLFYSCFLLCDMLCDMNMLLVTVM